MLALSYLTALVVPVWAELGGAGKLPLRSLRALLLAYLRGFIAVAFGR